MYERILEMINELFGDESRTKEDVLSDLQGLRGEIEILIENIESDIEEGK